MLSNGNTRYISLIKNLALKVVSMKTYLLTKRQTSRGMRTWTIALIYETSVKESYVAIGVEWRFTQKEFQGIPKASYVIFQIV